MELSNQEINEIEENVTQKVGTFHSHWNEVDSTVLIISFFDVISELVKSKRSECLSTNSKKEWETFVQADKDRAIAMNNMIQGNGNNELLESRYRAACYQWEDHRKAFIQTAKERTGAEPIWDFEGCTLSNGEKYIY